MKCQGERNDYMLHYEQVFGNVFQRRESRCCAVLRKHRCKGKGEQVITLQMVQQLKTKKFNVVPRQLYCRQCKAKFQPVTDTDTEFTKRQTPRKKLQLIGILPASLHTFMKILKSDILEAYKVQVDCLKDSQSDFYNKNDMKKKANDLIRLHEAMKEKLETVSYSEQIQILTLVPDKWSRMYC